MLAVIVTHQTLDNASTHPTIPNLVQKSNRIPISTVSNLKKASFIWSSLNVKRTEEHQHAGRQIRIEVGENFSITPN